jgi:competence protein ComGC
MNTTKKLMTGIALGASAIALLIGSTGVAQAHGSNHGGGLPSSLVADGTLTEVQATAVKDAMRASKEVQKDAAIAALVTAGTITQTQADALEAAEGDRGAMRALIADGTFTMEQAQALRAAKQANKSENRDAQRDAVLSTLVSNGTITQAQAEAIKASKASKAESGTRGQGRGAAQGASMTPAVSSQA